MHFKELLLFCIHKQVDKTFLAQRYSFMTNNEKAFRSEVVS